MESYHNMFNRHKVLMEDFHCNGRGLGTNSMATEFGIYLGYEDTSEYVIWTDKARYIVGDGNVGKERDTEIWIKVDFFAETDTIPQKPLSHVELNGTSKEFLNLTLCKDCLKSTINDALMEEVATVVKPLIEACIYYKHSPLFPDFLRYMHVDGVDLRRVCFEYQLKREFCSDEYLEKERVPIPPRDISDIYYAIRSRGYYIWQHS